MLTNAIPVLFNS